MILAFAIQAASGVTQGTAVISNGTAEQCDLPGGANVDKFLGVAMNDEPNQFALVAVQMGTDNGPARGIAAGVIAVGDYINIAGATGKFQSCQTAAVATSGGASNVYVCGRALTAAAADGDQFDFEIVKFVKTTPA